MNMTRPQIIRLGVLLVIALASALGVGLSMRASDRLVIKIAFLGSSDDEDYHGAMALKRHVEAALPNQVTVRVYPAGQFCGNERECIEALRAGTLEVLMTTVGGVGNIFGPVQVLDLPYALKEDRVAECVLAGAFVDDLRQGALDAGLAMRLMLISNTGGWRALATTSRPIYGPDDVAGLKLRTTPADIQQRLVQALGASPTPIAFSELYTALATGVVDGTKNSIQDIVGTKLHEHVKFITLDNHAYMAALWWFSETRWRQMPEAFKPAVLAGFQKLKAVTLAIPKQRAAEDLASFKAAGGAVHVPSAAQQAAFTQAAAGLRPWLAQRFGAIWLQRLDAAVGDCRARLANES
ncbi:MAG: TRAP transporter substrate-binding protein [Sphingomonadales bacterium]